MERQLVPPSGTRCIFYPMAPPGSLRGIVLTIAATLRSLLLIARLKPRAAYATGGYVSVPAAIACWLLRVPFVLFLPDVVPGKAVAWLAPLARRIAVSTEAARAHLPAEKTMVTGYPVRDVFRQVGRAQGRERFSLPADARVLFVFGGSQGSRSINQALARHLPAILDQWHVVHVCGEKREAEARAAEAALRTELRSRYQLFPYLQAGDMAAALAAADLALCRSGASTLGELPATGTPAILVPLPEIAVHQAENAACLAGHGAAIVVPDAELEKRLAEVLTELIEDERRLEQMASACRALDRPDAAASIAALVMQEAA